MFKIVRKATNNQQLYTYICFATTLEISKAYTRSLKASVTNLRRAQKRSEPTGMFGSLTTLALSKVLKDHPELSQPTQTGGPSVPTSLLDAYLNPDLPVKNGDR